MEPTLFAPPQPYGYLTLDIETDNGSPDSVERELRATWVPAANLKTPIAIGQKWLEMVEERKDKRALMDSAPVKIVSLKSETELRALHCLEGSAPRLFEGGLVEGFASERAMLVALRDGILDPLTSSDTEIVGHNIRRFDLKKLRYRYCAQGLRLPRLLAPRSDLQIFDTMDRFTVHFAKDERPFVALDFVLKEFGIPSHKGEMDGSKVPAYIAERRFDELLRYALRDALAEEQLYLRMTGQLEDAPAVAA